jgi:hypothetical protein
MEIKIIKRNPANGLQFLYAFVTGFGTRVREVIVGRFHVRWSQIDPFPQCGELLSDAP